VTHDDPLLRALGDLAQHEDPVEDPRLDELSADTLSEDERQDLAKQNDDTMTNAAYEAFRPIGPEARERFVEAIVDQRACSTSAKVVPFPRRSRWMVGMAGVGALAAAAALLLVLSSGGPEPLPSYELMVLGGETTTRAEPAQGTPRLLPGSRLELRLRPATGVKGPVDVRGALQFGQTVRAWNPPVDKDDRGAARIVGTREKLFPGVPDGRCTVVVAVGRPEALPSEPEELLAVERGADPTGIRLHRLTVDIASEPDPTAP